MVERLAIITNSFPQVSETFIVRQARYLNAKVIASSINEKDFGYYDFEYSKVFGLGTEKDTQKTILSRIMNKIQNRPVAVWPNKFHSRLERYLVDNKIEVVLAQFGTNGIHALPVCKKLNIPLVIQFLGYDASSLLRYKWYQDKIKEALEYASAAVVLYDGMQVPFTNLGVQKSKFNVINIGVPIEKFEMAKMENERKIKFLAVGRFVEKKAPLIIIKAFEKCADKNPNVELNMVGNGVLFDEAQELVNKSVHKNKINLLGYLSQSELKPLYKASHIFLQHSVTASDGNTEGWPVGIAEACASGLPVISTKHAGIKEQVIHGETGYLVDEYDIEGMSRYMFELSNNYELCKKMGLAARKHIEQHGSLNTQLNKLEELIESIKL